MIDMIGNYDQFLTQAEIIALVAALDRPLFPAIRINTLKVDPAQSIAAWRARFGWHAEPVAFCPTGWQLTDTPETSLGRALPHRMGHYYIQDAASMIPAEMFTPANRPFILDMAAAPGGKTTHLVSRFNDRALIVANDSSQNRITALRSNLQTWGATGVLITNYVGEQLGGWLHGKFDKVLLDAPCSGETLREEKGSKKRHVSDTERERLSQRQLAMLISALRAVKVGGEIVYSTCTLNPAENEGVLSALLREYPVEIEAVEGFPQTGLVADDFHPSVAQAVRLWPHLFHTSGFFAARLRKVGDITPIDAHWPLSRYPWTRLRDVDVKPIVAHLQDDYGFDLEGVMANDDLELYKKDDLLYAIPTPLMAEFGNLATMSIGLLIGQQERGGFIPSHELVSRFWDRFREGRFDLPDADQQQIWLDGRDLRGLDIPPALMGRIVLMVNEWGEFIGRGRTQPDRIRNLLPKRVV